MENIKNFLSNKITLLMVMICLVFCVQVFTLFKNEDETQKVNYIKKEIKELKKDVNKIYSHYDDLGVKIDTFKRQVEKIHKSVKINNIKIENLKKYEKNQIDKFKSYNASMFERFFTERYAEKIKTSTNGAK